MHDEEVTNVQKNDNEIGYKLPDGEVTGEVLD
jgi:hypothetical protein